MNTKFKVLKPKNRTLVHTVDTSLDGTKFVIGQGSDDAGHANLSLWTFEDFALISELERRENEVVLLARYSPNGKSIAYVDSALEPRLYNLEKRKSVRLNLQNRYVRWLAYAKKSDRIVVAGALTQVWDEKKSKVIWTVPGKIASRDPDVIPAVADISPDGTQIAVAGEEDGSILIYNVDDGNLVQSLKGGPDHARWVSFDPLGRYVAAIEWYSHGTYLWDVQSGKMYLSDIFNSEAETYWCLRFHPDGNHLALGMLSGYVVMIKLDDGEFVIDQKAHKGRVWDLAFTPNGKYMVSGGEDGIVCIWDLE